MYPAGPEHLTHVLIHAAKWMYKLCRTAIDGQLLHLPAAMKAQWIPIHFSVFTEQKKRTWLLTLEHVASQTAPSVVFFAKSSCLAAVRTCYLVMEIEAHWETQIRPPHRYLSPLFRYVGIETLTLWHERKCGCWMKVYVHLHQLSWHSGVLTYQIWRSERNRHR